MPASAPVLETDRLRLRAHRAADLPQFAALWAEEAVTRYTIGKPATEEESWLRLMRSAGHWQLLGFGYWIVEEKTTGTVIGEAGLADLHRDIVPSIDGTPEAGWVFASAAHGKGYATEALRAIFAWHRERTAAGRLATPRIVCLIDPANAPSLRLAARLGFTEFARTIYRGQAAILLENRETLAPRNDSSSRP